jgi:hypothetical protein
VNTLVFCTSYFDSPEAYERRYQKWINHHWDALPNEHMFFIDDGSNLDLFKGVGVGIMSFPDRRGENWSSHPANHEGWWRSFGASLGLAKERDCRKIIHVESDAYIISARLARYMGELNSGWTALWCPTHNFPESSIQIICEDQFERFDAFLNREPSELAKLGLAEQVLPFTHVEKNFIGDRYEHGRSPPEYVDFHCQYPPERQGPLESPHRGKK